MGDDLTRVESRVAGIEGQLVHLISRLTTVEADLRDIRKFMDGRLDKLNAKIDKVDINQESKLETAVGKLDAKIGCLRT